MGVIGPFHKASKNAIPSAIDPLSKPKLPIRTCPARWPTHRAEPDGKKPSGAHLPPVGPSGPGQMAFNRPAYIEPALRR